MIVVKVGGSKELNIDAIVADIAALHQTGRPLLLVHGGAETTNDVATALGHPPEFVTSESGYVSRRTDRRTLEIFEMVYCGQLNKMWVEKLQTQSINAVGLSGLDGRIFELSPNGNYLIFTRKSTKSPDQEINTLWAVRTDGSKPFSTGISNVVHFADWIPGTNSIAYSTVEPRALAPDSFTVARLGQIGSLVRIARSSAVRSL